MNKNLFMIIVAVILVVLWGSISGYINDNSEQANNKTHYLNYNYQIRFNTSINNSFYLIIPTLINKTNMQISNLELNFTLGNGSIQFENSKYGPAINISSNSSFTINSGGRMKIIDSGDIDNDVLHMSLLNNQSEDSYWREEMEFMVYLSEGQNTNISSLSIEFKEGYRTSWYSIIIDGEISSGWSRLKSEGEIISV